MILNLNKLTLTYLILLVSLLSSCSHAPWSSRDISIEEKSEISNHKELSNTQAI